MFIVSKEVPAMFSFWGSIWGSSFLQLNIIKESIIIGVINRILIDGFFVLDFN
jgi:hypothetical protein